MCRNARLGVYPTWRLDTDETASPGGAVHSYSRDFPYTPHIYGFLALLAYGIYWLASLAPLPAVLHIGPLISLTIFGILLIIFDRWAWKLFCYIPGIEIVNLGGTYLGTLRPKGKENYDVTFTIRQRWSRLSIHIDSNGAPSDSFSAAITKDRLRADEIELVYNYTVENHRDGRGVVTLPRHHGAAMLKVLDNGERLEGEYYTEQQRNSWGKISITRT
jgi:hypothetical protein